MKLSFGQQQELERKRYYDKKWHTLESVRVALSSQIKKDYKEFEKGKVMRCWDCAQFSIKELKRVEKLQRKREKVLIKRFLK